MKPLIAIVPTPSPLTPEQQQGIHYCEQVLVLHSEPAQPCGRGKVLRVGAAGRLRAGALLVSWGKDSQLVQQLQPLGGHAVALCLSKQSKATTALLQGAVAAGAHATLLVKPEAVARVWPDGRVQLCADAGWVDVASLAEHSEPAPDLQEEEPTEQHSSAQGQPTGEG